MWRDKFIAVDWGTTNRRAWLIDDKGSVVDSFADDLGLLSLPDGGFEFATSHVRQMLGEYPMLMAGMVGSDKGWRTAGYVSCPADIKSLAANICWIDDHFTGIVPGVCQTGGSADVMRGEEVQAFGAQTLGKLSGRAYLCHPGTHTKWIEMDNGRIDQFQTAMTGEVFQLMRTQSILADQLADDVLDGPAFHEGLRDARRGTSILKGLFEVRARHLLNQLPQADASYASGLLIGTDVGAAIINAAPTALITIVGRPDLCALYATAITAFGYENVTVDGATAFQAGINAIINHFSAGKDIGSA